MVSKEIMAIVAIVCLVAAGVGIAAFALNNDDNTEKGDLTSVYLTDNFENDEFTDLGPYATQKYNVIPGIWLYGTGSDAKSVIKSACNNYGIQNIEFDAGKISKIGDITDGNIHVRYWDGKQWVQCNDIDTMDMSKTKFISVIHGKAAAGGEAPSVNTTPDEIKWHYGERVQHKVTSGKMVKYYLSANFEYSFTQKAGSSNPNTLLVKGIWISGYAPKGSTTDVAFKNALDEIGYEYNIENMFINYINKASGGNFLQAVWDKENNQWMRDTEKGWFGENLVDDTEYMSITYGAWGGESGYDIPPYPQDKLPGEDDWYF